MNVLAEQIETHFPKLEKSLAGEIARVGRLAFFEKGEVLLKKGQYIRSILLVLEGTAKVFRQNGGANPYFLHYMQAGEACALSMLFTSRRDPSHLNIIAAEKTSVICLPLSVMEHWMTAYKSWNEFVWDTLRQRLSTLFDVFDNIIFHNMDERLTAYLDIHVKMLKTKKLPITRTEMARDLNTSREVITRLLKKQSDKGALIVHRRFIEML